tara:strand:+ start:449 stop:937 length:489 start_codon:yes stop_codon:yes gene_type:complete
MAKIHKQIDLSEYVIDFESIKNNYNVFNSKLENLKNINIGDKIGFDDNDKIYIISNSKVQSIVRWVYGQNRENTINKLSLIMEDYKKLLRLVTLSNSHLEDYNTNNDGDILELHNFTNVVKIFNKDILIGLNNLKNTYKYDDIYKDKIHKLEFILSNFENGF